MKLSEKMNGISSNVNLLRFIAAIFVIFSHSFYVAASKDDPFSVFCGGQANLGGFAVAIFFFLSGFYVTKSLRKKDLVGEYLYKRCTRIFPQLWVTVLLSVLVLGPALTSLPIGEYFLSADTYKYLLNGIFIPIHNLPGVFENNLYDTAVNGSLWTLPVEFAAYCALAVILFVSRAVFKNKNLQKVFHIICFGVLFAGFIVLDVFIKNDFLITVVRPMIIFFAGVLYFDFADKIKLNYVLAFAMLIVLVISCKLGFLNYALIIALPYIVVTFALGTKQLKINGKIFMISYEMYLLGWPIQQVVTHFFGGEMNPYVNCLITLPINILLAYLLYIFIEKAEKGRKNGK